MSNPSGFVVLASQDRQHFQNASSNDVVIYGNDGDNGQQLLIGLCNVDAPADITITGSNIELHKPVYIVDAQLYVQASQPGIILASSNIGKRFIALHDNGNITYDPSVQALQVANTLGQVSLSAGGSNTLTLRDDGSVQINNGLNPAPGGNGYKLSVDGNIYATGDIISSSDARFKSNLTVISSALDRVRQLTGYTYDRIHGVDVRRDAGLLAQDVLEVLPEAVHADKSGALSVAYGNIIALIVQSIKELDEKVNDLIKMQRQYQWEEQNNN